MRPVRSVIGGVLAVTVMAGLVASAAGPLGASRATARDPYPRDGKLTLADVQMLGTHNSYHLRPDREVAPTEPANYEHPPLDVQLEDQGIRSLEIDAYDGPDLPVFHSLIVDDRSTCPTLAECLDIVATWSKRNPGHVPLVLFVEPKALPTNTNPDIQAVIDAPPPSMASPTGTQPASTGSTRQSVRRSPRCFSPLTRCASSARRCVTRCARTAGRP